MLLLAGLFSLTTASAEPFTLEIDPTSVTSIVANDKVFGLTAYGKQPSAALFNVTTTPGSISQIGTTTISWDFWLPKTGNVAGGPWTPAAINAWFASPAAAKKWAAAELKHQLELYTTLKLHPQWTYLNDCVPGEGLNASGGTPLGTCMPTNAFNFGVAHGNVLKLARTVSEITTAHLINEPNAHWWRVIHNGTRVKGDHYADFFVTAVQGLRSVLGDDTGIKFGGPTTYNCPSGDFLPWSTGKGSVLTQWQDYPVSLLDKALPVGALGYYDFHSYDSPAEWVLAEIHLVTSYADVKHNVSGFQAAVTEQNYGISSHALWANRSYHYHRRTLPQARLALRLLQHSSRVAGRQLFNFDAAGNANECFEGDPDLPITPEAQLYSILAPLRGTVVPDRLIDAAGSRVAESAAVPVVHLATASPDGVLTVALVNDSPDPQTVSLTLPAALSAAGADSAAPPALLDAAVLGVDGYRPSPGAGVAVPVFGGAPATLAAGTVSVFRYKLAAPAVTTVVLEDLNCPILNMPTSGVHDNLCNVTVPHGATVVGVKFGLKGPGNATMWEIGVGEQSHRLVPGHFATAWLADPTAVGAADDAAPVPVTLRATEPIPTSFPTWITFVSVVTARKQPVVRLIHR